MEACTLLSALGVLKGGVCPLCQAGSSQGLTPASWVRSHSGVSPREQGNGVWLPGSPPRPLPSHAVQPFWGGSQRHPSYLA